MVPATQGGLLRARPANGCLPNANMAAGHPAGQDLATQGGGEVPGDWQCLPGQQGALTVAVTTGQPGSAALQVDH